MFLQRWRGGERCGPVGGSSKTATQRGSSPLAAVCSPHHILHFSLALLVSPPPPPPPASFSISLRYKGQRRRREWKENEEEEEEDPALTLIELQRPNVGTARLRSSDKEVLDFLASWRVIGPEPCGSKSMSEQYLPMFPAANTTCQVTSTMMGWQRNQGPSFLPSSRSSQRSLHPPGCPSVSMSLPRLEKGRNERKEMTDERKREEQPKGSDESALS
ncbi:hypothetical protein F7725_023318, partial [Dissostichus mawsoni]